jgi:hypothetical protein
VSRKVDLSMTRPLAPGEALEGFLTEEELRDCAVPWSYLQLCILTIAKRCGIAPVVGTLTAKTADDWVGRRMVRWELAGPPAEEYLDDAGYPDYYACYHGGCTQRATHVHPDYPDGDYVYCAVHADYTRGVTR